MATDIGKTLPHAWQRCALRDAQELTRSGGDPMHMLTGLSRDQLRTIFQLHDKLSWGERLNAVDTSRLCALFPAVPREAVAERIAHVNAHSTPQHRVQAFVQSVVSRDAADGAAVRQAGELGAHHLHLDMVGDLEPPSRRAPRQDAAGTNLLRKRRAAPWHICACPRRCSRPASSRGFAGPH